MLKKLARMAIDKVMTEDLDVIVMNELAEFADIIKNQQEVLKQLVVANNNMQDELKHLKEQMMEVIVGFSIKDLSELETKRNPNAS